MLLMPSNLEPTKQQKRGVLIDSLGALGQGLLASSGYSATPVSLGQAFGNAMPAFNQAKQQGLLAAKQENKQKAIGGLLGDPNISSQDKLLNYGLLSDNPSAIVAGLKPGSGVESVIGKLNPGLYTPESLNRFSQSNNYGDLSFRDGLGSFMAGGVNYSRDGRATVSPELIAENKALIDSTVESEKIKAKDKAAAVTSLPEDRLKAEMMVEKIDQLVNHPGMSDVVGIQSVGSLLGFPGTDAQDFKALLEQVQGGTFLEAFKALKGGGTITEVEGKKAEQALARLQTAQSEDAFKKAAKEFQIEVQKLLQLKEQSAGKTEVNQDTTIDDLLNKYGG